MKKKTRKALIGYSFISLWIIGFLVLMVYTLANSLIYSFSKVTISGNGIILEFVGFSNYLKMFEHEQGFKFLESLLSFSIELILNVPVITVFSIIIAILLNAKIKFRGFFRSIYFLPVIISSGPVINELISQGAGGSSLIEQYGVITLINESLPLVLAKPIAGLFSQIIIIFWFSGVQILVFLSGLQKIDQSVYEASSIDGAGPWESFWKITLPSLKNLIFINVIYTIITLATFSSNNAVMIIKDNMFKPETGYGFASSLAWVYMIVVTLFLFVATFIFKNKEKVI